MIRYCLTEGHKILPCNVGWANYNSNGVRSCKDDPPKKNCPHLINENIKQTCPYCGNVLQGKKEDVK